MTKRKPAAPPQHTVTRSPPVAHLHTSVVYRYQGNPYATVDQLARLLARLETGERLTGVANAEVAVIQQMIDRPMTDKEDSVR